MKTSTLVSLFLLLLPLVASAQTRVVHDNAIVSTGALPYASLVDARRVRFTVTVPSTVVVNVQANVEGSACVGSSGCTDASRQQVYAAVYARVTDPGSTAMGSATYTYARLYSWFNTGNPYYSSSGSTSLSIPIGVVNTVYSLPPGQYDAVTSGFNATINPTTTLRHLSTTIMIIPE